MWNRNGRELFYRSGNAMMAVEIPAQQGFVAGNPSKLFEGPYLQSDRGMQQYDVSPDGQHFLMLKPIVRRRCFLHKSTSCSTGRRS